jgi:hypothetical protein
MSLEAYFNKLIERVETSGEITNAGKDENGFYKPTKTVILRHLNLIKDLHSKPLAKEMVKSSWNKVVEELPPDWLILTPAEKKELQSILG